MSSWVYDPLSNQLVLKEDYKRIQAEAAERLKAAGEVRKTVHVISDIDPYLSHVNNEWITSRSQHRKHLKEHGYIEIGNEDPRKWVKRRGYDPGNLKADIAQALKQHGVIS